MAGSWSFCVLFGLLVLVNSCYSKAASLTKKSAPNDEYNTISRSKADINDLLQQILGSLHRINDILTFKILDDEARRSNLQSQLAKTSRQGKCRLQKLLFGVPCNQTEKQEKSVKDVSDNYDDDLDSMKKGQKSENDGGRRSRTGARSFNSLRKQIAGGKRTTPSSYEKYSDESKVDVLSTDDDGPGTLNDDIIDSYESELNDEYDAFSDDDSDIILTDKNKWA